MLKKLVEFFKNKDFPMERSLYAAHVDAPYSIREIDKEFKKYNLMLEAVKAELAKPAPVAPKPKAAPKVAEAKEA